jgi:hypothetical protein
MTKTVPSEHENSRALLPVQRSVKRREFLPLSLVMLIKAAIGHTNGKLIVSGPEVER